jgi:hypothetical protein
MATLDDVLTTQKNGVIALNNIFQATKFQTGRQAGQYRSVTVTALTEVARGPGILVAFTVVVAGTVAGSIYDSITPTTTLATGTGGGGGVATITYSPNLVFAVGDTVVVQNVVPAGYNTTGSTVTASTANSVSYSNPTTGSQTGAGVVFNQKASLVMCATPLTIGTYLVGAPFTTGLVIVPGTGQSINAIYSLD